MWVGWRVVKLLDSSKVPGASLLSYATAPLHSATLQPPSKSNFERTTNDSNPFSLEEDLGQVLQTRLSGMVVGWVQESAREGREGLFSWECYSPEGEDWERHGLERERRARDKVG